MPGPPPPPPSSLVADRSPRYIGTSRRMPGTAPIEISYPAPLPPRIDAGCGAEPVAAGIDVAAAAAAEPRPPMRARTTATTRASPTRPHIHGLGPATDEVLGRATHNQRSVPIAFGAALKRA